MNTSAWPATAEVKPGEEFVQLVLKEEGHHNTVILFFDIAFAATAYEFARKLNNFTKESPK